MKPHGVALTGALARAVPVTSRAAISTMAWCS